MARFMLDTCTCIYAIKRKPAPVFDRLRHLQVGDVAVSAITVGELQFGVEKSAQREQNQQKLREFLSPLELLDWPQSASTCYGEIRSYLEARGKVIGSLDMLIAAHAVHIGSTLVTNNTNQFARVPGLLVVDWTK